MSAPRASPAGLTRDAFATASLGLYSLVVAAGFARVFSGWAFLVDLAVLVVVGHGVSFLLRRARVTGWLAVPFTTLLLAWVLIAQQYTDTLSWMLPTSATWEQLDLEVGLVRDQFPTAVAPVLYGAGWATLAGVALIIAVVMADSFAFRAESRGETLVPGGVLFVFIAALSSPRLRVTSTMLLIGAGVLVVIALRRLHDRSRRVELASRRGPASMAIPTAVATAVVVALVAGFIGPRLPGAQAEPLYQTRGRGGSTTSVLSPLVDIRSRLTNRGNVELFKINADRPAYWRVTTLPEFDGQTFGLPTRSLERIDGAIGPTGGDGSVPTTPIRQQVQVRSLGGKLVPAAAEPAQAEGFSGGQRIDLRLNRDTSTLVTPDEMLPGDLFTVVSAAPTLTPDLLRDAPSSNPPDPVFLELPDDLPGIVAQLAAEVTEGASGTYERALALQSWFRSEEFEYSTEVQRGHGSSAIESFLTQRVGYCEQFSATFAAMARTLGIPSRVAVGFTPGVLGDDGWYSVLGRNAHAWPELWFDGIGWVSFEPTPGRGEPGAEAYTDVEPEQDDTTPAAAGGAADPDRAPDPTTPSTVVPPANPNFDDREPSVPVDDPNLIFGDGQSPGSTTDGTSGGSTTPWVLLGLLVLLIATVATPAAVRWLRMRSLRRLTGRERVQRAWARALSSAELAGVAGRPSMTAREWAAATADQLPVAARPMRSLAELVDRVTFARSETVELEPATAFGTKVGYACDLWSEQVGRIAVDTLTPLQRIRHYFAVWR